MRKEIFFQFRNLFKPSNHKLEFVVKKVIFGVLSYTFSMNGRVFRIKKSILLKSFAVICFVLFLVLTFLSFSTFKIPDLWFFSFCLMIGSFEIFKSFLFNFDSSFYLGTLTFFIGISGFVFWLTHTTFYAPFYICFAFVFSSLLTFFVCGQRFHLIIAYSITFVTIFAFLLTKNLITMPIFIAFVLPFLVLLVVSAIIGIKRRR